jgi:hypothetical protein
MVHRTSESARERKAQVTALRQAKSRLQSLHALHLQCLQKIADLRGHFFHWTNRPSPVASGSRVSHIVRHRF